MGEKPALKIPNVSEESYKWWVLASIALGTFMGPLDGSIVNIALPSISSYFHTSLAMVEWVVMSYLLMISSLLLTYGRLGDMYGHKPIYLGGFVIFTLGSALCGFSPGIGFLIGARVLQAVGAGMMMAIGPAIVTSTFPPHLRGRALGMNGSVVASALAFGPAIGGLLLSQFGWRSIFFVNLPIGIIGTLWAVRILRRDERLVRHRFDIPGAVTIFAGLMFLLLSLSHGGEWGWSSPAVLFSLAAAVVFLGLFIYLELRSPEPMMDLRLFRIRLFAAANATSLLNFMAQFSITFLLPFYLEQVRHLNPAHAGLVLSAPPFLILFVAPLSGALSDRIGSRLLSSLGMAITAAGMFWLSRVGVATPYAVIVAGMAVFGLGTGLFQAPNNSAIMGSVPRQRLGTASGTLASMRNIGMVLGIALSGAVFSGRLPVHDAVLRALGRHGAALQAQAFTMSMQDAYLVGASLAALGVLTSLVRGRAAAPAPRPDTGDKK
ncbi:hypothetical protein A6M21_05890 [Desulfotomaculum copahuensis]|uniref:Major facilitator superfamily (MFS) profile domain-containing protein n=1 Tax=Desulfotomaculum copahuensis TaxID=1838280 RepID=A0A1B7LGX3_9FIRM|nr:hypothetical protein A6M21_05890 [Desulfotomaculum copahuensis]